MDQTRPGADTRDNQPLRTSLYAGSIVALLAAPMFVLGWVVGTLTGNTGSYQYRAEYLGLLAPMVALYGLAGLTAALRREQNTPLTLLTLGTAALAWSGPWTWNPPSDTGAAATNPWTGGGAVETHLTTLPIWVAVLTAILTAVMLVRQTRNESPRQQRQIQQ